MSAGFWTHSSIFWQRIFMLTPCVNSVKLTKLPAKFFQLIFAQLFSVSTEISFKSFRVSQQNGVISFAAKGQSVCGFWLSTKRTWLFCAEFLQGMYPDFPRNYVLVKKPKKKVQLLWYFSLTLMGQHKCWRGVARMLGVIVVQLSFPYPRIWTYRFSLRAARIQNPSQNKAVTSNTSQRSRKISKIQEESCKNKSECKQNVPGCKKEQNIATSSL